jgi:general secretion pathway protein D
MIRRKRLTSLGLAVAVVLPNGLTGLSRLFAGEAAVPASPLSSTTQPTMTNGQLLEQGISQFNKGQYEESVATLQSVDSKSLSDTAHKTVVDTLAKATEAASDRKAARDEFQRGEDARKANRMMEAMDHYQAVLNNSRADAGTVKKAQEQLALVQAAQKNAQGTAKAAYDQGVNEFNKGLWDQARTDFTTAQNLGYTAGFMQDSPAEMLAKIDQGQKDYMAKQAAAQQNTQQTAQKSQAQQAYDKAREEYRDGNWTAAKQDFIAARDMGFKPGFLEGLSPSEYLTRMDEKQAEDAKAAANTPAPNTPATNSPAAGAPMLASGAVATGTSSATGQTVDRGTTTQAGNGADQLKIQAANDAAVKQQMALKAQGEVDLAKKAEAAGNTQAAADYYAQAAIDDPTNAAAIAGRDRLQAQLGITPAGAGGGGAALNDAKTKITIEIQALTAQFNTGLSDARTDIAANNFAKAQADIDRAEQATTQDPTIFNTAQMQDFNARLAQARKELDQAKVDYTRQQQVQASSDAQAAEREREKLKLQENQAAIESLIKLSREQIDVHNYAAALGVIDQILALDPNNEYALGIQQLVEDKAVIQDQRHYREKFDFEFSKQLNAGEEKTIPYDDILRYPDNWPDISQERDEETQAKGLSTEDQQVQALLARRLPSVQFKDTPLSDAIDFLRDLTGANILVNWNALQAAGIDKQTVTINASLHDVPFSKVLTIVLDQAGPGKLGYNIEDGVITISTMDELNKKVVTRVYDISDLLVNPNFDSTIDTQSALQNALGGGLGGSTGGVGGSTGGAFGGGGGSSFGGQQGQNGQNGQNGSNNGSGNLQQQLQDIEKKIKNTVDYDTWKDNGGTGSGTIDDFNNQLIITQTPSVHSDVQGLLDKLRETRSVQVTVEVRFLTVERHFIEDIGVNLGLGFNQNTLAGTRGIQPFTVSDGSADFTKAPLTGVPNTIGSQANGLDVGFSYLDDISVSLLLRATQANVNSSIVHAPRVTMQSGQGATLLQETAFAYVSSINSAVGNGAPTGTPVISYATDGVTLQILRAIVDADHKYVTLDLDPQLNAFGGFTTFTFQSPAAGGTTGNTGATGTTGGGGTGTIVVGTGAATAPEETLQEPKETVTEVRTRATVPDGGTLLLGGLTVAGEVDEQAGVPVLSKIPFLKRLTTNTSQAKDEDILIILVKPTIIIDKEIEAHTFPLLSSKTPG